MTYATLMVHLQVGQPNGPVLRAAAGLAERFGAGVIGVAACQPMQLIYSDGYIAGDAFEQDRQEKDREVAAAEAAFRAAFRDRSNVLKWRSTVTLASSCAWVADQARSADLIVTGVAAADPFDPSRRVDTGELLMQAGRPVLVVPAGADALDHAPTLDNAMIAWKDTRETRRAVLDALPLLQRVARVSVVEAAEEEDMASARQHVADVVAWLGRHGISADGEAVHRNGDDAGQLDGIARERGADLIVAGAYGHSRVREWALGGVTRSLLQHSHRCSLLSH
ncbi:MAG: universal stress protein [Janthinobacterium lividum]